MKRHIFSTCTPHDLSLTSLTNPQPGEKVIQSFSAQEMFNFLNDLSHFSFKIAENSAWSEERAVVSGSRLRGFSLHWLPLTRGRHRLAGYVCTSGLHKSCHGLCCMNITFSFKHRRGSGRALQISRRGMSETLLMFYGF